MFLPVGKSQQESYYLGVIISDRTAKNRVTAQWTDFEILQ
jgi:hypothetical protein